MTRQEMRVLARRNVSDWPALTPEQVDRLYVLLAPMRASLKNQVGKKAAALNAAA